MRWIVVALGVAVPLPALAQTQIDIRDFCDPSLADHTTCISDWIDKGRMSPGAVLFASAGEYRYRDKVVIYSGMRLRCAGPDRTLFKNQSPPSGDGAGDGTLLHATGHVDNVQISDCAFDVNKNATNFLAVISINPQSDLAPSSRIRVRRNRFFDSQGTPAPPTKHNQRQYILLANCRDCRVEDNQLRNGGRIKVGRPGWNIRILRNVVEDANDNAITVADLNDGFSSDILIADNRVIKPVGVGIYFGADSDVEKWPLMRLSNVRIRRNYIEGEWTVACIFGRLPFDTRLIRVTSNQCVRTSASLANSQTTGIQIRRSCEAFMPARDLAIRCNRISTSASGGTALDLAGIYLIGLHSDVRILENEVRSIGPRSILFRFADGTNARVQQNTLTGGVFRIEGTASGDLQAHEQAPSSGAVWGCDA
jgi:hypothetical protein